MANSILDVDLLLIDKFPGAVNRNIRTPTAEQLRTAYLTEAAAGFRVGDKVEIFDPDQNMPVRFLFAKFMKGADDIDLAVGDICGIFTTTPHPYELMNDGDEALLYGPLAISCFTCDYGNIFTTGGATYVFGWFWVQGMAPVALCTTAAGVKSFSGLHTATSSAAAGEFCIGADVSGYAMGLATIAETVKQGAGSIFGLVAAH